jgi:fluoride exporter
MISNYWLVAIGGALGSVARVWVAQMIGHRFGTNFPWGTLFVNVTGSMLIGIFAGLSEGRVGSAGIAPSTRNFLIAGVCGGYTTFSAFSLQTLNLAQQKEWLLASANAVLSFTLCLGAVWLGFMLTARTR